MPGRRTHWSRLKALRKSHAFLCKLIDIRRLCLPAVTADVSMRTVVRDDEKKVRLLCHNICGTYVGSVRQAS
jgi:hypothetical protein